MCPLGAVAGSANSRPATMQPRRPVRRAPVAAARRRPGRCRTTRSPRAAAPSRPARSPRLRAQRAGFGGREVPAGAGVSGDGRGHRRATSAGVVVAHQPLGAAARPSCGRRARRPRRRPPPSDEEPARRARSASASRRPPQRGYRGGVRGVQRTRSVVERVALQAGRAPRAAPGRRDQRGAHRPRRQRVCGQVDPFARSPACARSRATRNRGRVTPAFTRATATTARPK